MTTIDGSFGEGGGQILRTSLSLSALTGQPFHITNIRLGREKPGLRPQHLAGVRAVARICGAQISGDEVGSLQLSFEPGELKGGSYTFNVAEGRVSAGATTLIAQALIPPLFFASEDSSIVLQGGTHVPFSPPFEYLERVFVESLHSFGVNVRVQLERAGWMPAGGGEFRIRVRPVERIDAMTFDEHTESRKVDCLVILSNLQMNIGVRQRDRMLARLKGSGTAKLNAEIIKRDSPGEGTMSIILVHDNIPAGFSVLGRRGKPSEKVADEAADEAIAFLQEPASVDKYLSDQLLIYCALAHGRSSFRTAELTLHSITNMRVIEQFLPVQFEVDGSEGQEGVIHVDGVGFKSRR